MLVFGKEITEGRRFARIEGSGALGGALRASGAGRVREFVEDWADGRVMDSFFMFRRDRGLLGEGRIKESASEVVEERAEVEAELSLAKRAMPGLCTGVSM